MLLNGKVALITGSTKGIGLAIARVAALLNGKTDFAIDVTSNASIVKSMTRLLVAHEHIDILLNDAGFPFERKFGTSLLTTSTTDQKAILQADTLGSVRLAKVVVRSMLANHRGGLIINISSTLAMSGHFKGAPYTMAKAAIVTLTKHIVCEYRRRNIQAYTLMLGNIATEATYKFMTEEERLRGAQEAAMKRWGEQDEVAKVAACVASENFSFATGNIITTDGGAVMS